MYIKFKLNNILFNVLYHIRVHVYMPLSTIFLQDFSTVPTVFFFLFFFNPISCSEISLFFCQVLKLIGVRLYRIPQFQNDILFISVQSFCSSVLSFISKCCFQQIDNVLNKSMSHFKTMRKLIHSNIFLFPLHIVLF